MTDELRTVDLANRVLAYREYGDPDGAPLLYEHSYPSSSLEAAYVDAAARRHRLRLIAVDRPGMGGSSLSPNRDIEETVRDIGVLINRLGITSLGVLGVGGGAPYAWVLGAGMPHRIKAIGVVGGDVEGHSHLLETAKAFMALGTLPFIGSRFRDPDKAQRAWTDAFKSTAPADQEVAQDADFRDHQLAAVADAFTEGSGGPAKDTALIHGAHWGFRMTDVDVPSALVWHGSDDRHVSAEQCRTFVDPVANVVVNVLDGEGHVSPWVRYHDQILAAMAEALRADLPA